MKGENVVSKSPMKSPAAGLTANGAQEMGGNYAPITSGSAPPSSTTIRITAGGAPSASCTLSTERKGEAIILKLSPAAADKVKAMGMTRATPEWTVVDGKITALNLYNAQAAGERGYVVGTSRRLRPHLSFPARNVTLARKPVVLSEPVEDGNALVFAVPDGAVVVSAKNGGA
jgi:hypothetical protein